LKSCGNEQKSSSASHSGDDGRPHTKMLGALLLLATATFAFLASPPLVTGPSSSGSRKTTLRVIERAMERVVVVAPPPPVVHRREDEELSLERMNLEVVTQVSFEEEEDERDERDEGSSESSSSSSSSTTSSPTTTASSPTTTTSSQGVGENSGVGRAMDSLFSGVFGLLHLFDESEVEDASKNLRVLWARSLLDAAGALDDKVAYELLPKWSRGVTRTKALRPLARFGEFVSSRSNFIDEAVETFRKNGGKRVVVLGAGYDTRALRFPDLDFVEVDRPSVAASKERLVKLKGPRRTGRHHFVAADLDDGALELEAKIRHVAPDFYDDEEVLCVVEAVLFYLTPSAKRSILKDHVLSEHLYDAVVVTDSFKPMLASPFKHDAVAFFEKRNFSLTDHASRWGGAVHFAAADNLNKREKRRQTSPFLPPPSEGIPQQKKKEKISYFPIASAGAARSWKRPSFDGAWYAVCFASQLSETNFDEARGGRKPYATRLWDEPLVVFREGDGRVVCLVDACPHRAAPLSMGRVDGKGRLTCWYHGWQFGHDGARQDRDCAKSQAKSYPAVEKDGLVYVWRGRPEAKGLDADLSLLPEFASVAAAKDPHHVVDTVLDYEVAYDFVVENNLDSPHLFYLHDGSVPALASLGMTRENLAKLQVQRFKDDVGVGHVGKLRGAARPNKLIRFDAPNVVRHGGVSGFHETFHIVPVGPRRTRVLLRQYLPKGPILQTLLDVPGVRPAIDTLVRNWNFHIALEDYSCLVGQSQIVDDFGAPRLNQPGVGDDLVMHFHAWRDQAIHNDGGREPYFSGWAPPTDDGGPSKQKKQLPSRFAAYERKVRGGSLQKQDFGGKDSRGGIAAAYGIRESFNANHPTPDFPPANAASYKPLWNAHQAVWSLFGMEPNGHSDLS